MGSGCSTGDCGCLAQAGQYALEPQALVEDVSSTVKGIGDAIDSNSRARKRRPGHHESQERLSRGRFPRGRLSRGRFPHSRLSPRKFSPRKTSPRFTSPRRFSNRRRLRGAGKTPLAIRRLPPIDSQGACESYQGDRQCIRDPWSGMDQLCGRKAPVNVLYANNQIYHAIGNGKANTDYLRSNLNPVFTQMPEVPPELCS